MVYTSGTTGEPKGVMLSHDNLVFDARCLVRAYGFKGLSGEGCQERSVSYLPLNHVSANVGDILVPILWYVLPFKTSLLGICSKLDLLILS